ncbi:MAG TPA: pirin family protein [Phycisphaerales bacterium]|nr:pirin family protein [Phycisphaerales bacterium]
MANPRTVESILPSPPTHWVGDGFPVSSVFSPRSVRNRLSPYVLFDYAGPARFEAAAAPRGVDTHPHRGFETVTVVYQGELEHRDSAGNSGSIGPGDVQWMTAASGILHEEKHSGAFTRRGGVLEMAQLWVNLPARDKMSAPRYQELRRDAIPTVALPDHAGTIRVIAGDFNGTKAAARTFSPVFLWDIRLGRGGRASLPVPGGSSAAAFLRSGAVRVSGTHDVTSRHLAIFDRAGGDVLLEASDDSELIVLGGEPIDEPVVAYGPFVMNTPEEIQAAIRDVQEGRFGRLD